MKGQRIGDPVFPLLTHPREHTSQRYHASIQDIKREKIPVFSATGPGCIKTMWICLSNTVIAPEQVEIEIYADDEATPRVDMRLFRFFGIFLDQYPYRIDCAAFQVLPRYVGPNAVAGFGFTSFLPIPFERSCTVFIKNRIDSAVSGAVYTDWHRYDNGAPVTPYRLHATYHGEFPAGHRDLFVMADVDGSGFVAGIFKGIRQRNHSDMIYHTGGQVWLIDGETEASAIHGCNEEDDFGFFWGYQETMSQLIGCPYFRHNDRLDQDGVIYRFFGNDAIRFRRSLYLASRARSDDTETTTYFYLKHGDATIPALPDFITDWQAVGPFPSRDYQTFCRREAPETSSEVWVRGAERGLRNGEIKAHRGWINMWPLFVRSDSVENSAPECIGDASAYLRATINAADTTVRTTQLTFCDFLSIWLNGEKVASFDHGAELYAESVALRLKKGANEVIVKTGHVDFRKSAQRDLWVYNFKLISG